MQDIDRFLKYEGIEVQSIEQIAASGSGRINYKVNANQTTYILTQNENIKENEAFFYLSKLFKNLQGNVPTVLKVSKDKKLYLQSFVGNESLLQKRLKGDDTSTYYQQSLQQLARLQIGAAQIVEETKLYDSIRFNAPLVYRDLFYFKDYFLDFTGIQYTQSQLLKEFETLTQKIEQSNYIYLMFRDFQGRNVMIDDKTLYFIDYQDAMFGPIAYDLVSILWQAKAELSPKEKNTYFEVYVNELKKLIPATFNINQFKKDYNACLILRLLQVLGAYGKLGIIQQNPHFMDSIKFGIQNLKAIQTETFMNDYPMLQHIIAQMSKDSIPKIRK